MAISIDNKERVRINMYVPKNTLDKIDKFAFDNDLTRTGAMLFMINNYLDNKQTINSLEELVKMLKTFDKLE